MPLTTPWPTKPVGSHDVGCLDDRVAREPGSVKAVVSEGDGSGDGLFVRSCQTAPGPMTEGAGPHGARVCTVVGLMRRLEAVRADGLSVGFVPTMGWLHDGHRALIDRARAENDCVVVSIFVNPLQFTQGEDFDRYPRDLRRDLATCLQAGADIVFAPGAQEMFAEPPATRVRVAALADTLCGASRPGHFDGVATVVAKLFSMVGACSAYFGEKDFQQLLIVRRLTADLSMPVTVKGCPTVREPDGLAMSSRNAYLSAAERAQAPALIRALGAGVEMVESGERSPEVVCARMESLMSAAPLARIDYTAAVSASTLRAENPLRGDVRLMVAARFGEARLIDNLGCHARAADEALG